MRHVSYHNICGLLGSAAKVIFAKSPNKETGRIPLDSSGVRPVSFYLGR